MGCAHAFIVTLDTLGKIDSLRLKLLGLGDGLEDLAWCVIALVAKLDHPAF